MIKLFAIDLDGTTLDNQSRLDNKVIEALKKLDENGIKFVFTSGRAKPSVDYLTSLTGFDNPTVANNGAIASINRENIIYENYLTYKNIEKLIEFCENYKLLYQFYDHDTYYSNRVCPERFSHLKKKSDYGMNYQVNFSFSANPLNEIKNRNSNVLKFQIFPKEYNKLSKDRIIEEIRKFNKNLYITSSNDKVIEIMQKNVSKYQAICEVSDYLGINRDEIAAIGDQDNDIPMLKLAKLSFAVENAIDEVKEIADVIVGSNDEFGIVEAIDIVIKRNKDV
ncbi:HAD family hydrolase [Anaerococcus sp. AGMB00486]|uniref:HAD family hydrolase n=2 Tax=Anaerococcus TaxID=165779 RepID=A0ABX2N7L5_9FIRM|nr:MULTISPECIES: HAD family hydrolase [Anaerococcus]MSS76984.1 HAD family hydrolase [Anaerococcus porci]NVF10527.1 HAD family hydrolase [Anaerococcus faecalis]